MRRGWARRLAQLALLLGGAGLGPLTAGASASNLLYYGGPVVHSARVILVEWGSDTRSTYTSPTTGDPGFFQYLASQDGSTADIGGVLAQYMDTSGQNSQNAFSFGGSLQISPTVGATPPGSVQDSQIQTELAKDIGSGALPSPSGDGLSTVYVVLFPPGDNVCFDGGGGCAYDASTGFCAYHGSFPLNGSSHVLYAAMVDNGPGSPNYGYCGSSSNDIQNQTAVVSHELSESINDPLVAEAASYAPPLGWYDPIYNGEIADKCDAQPAASNGPWTVESLWSNLDGTCEASETSFSAPIASFLAAAGSSAGQAVNFNAASSSDPSRNHIAALEQGVGSTYSISSGITQYRWNWGDGTSSTMSSTPTTTHTFAGPGTYQVSLTVTDQLGFTSTSTQPLNVTSSTTGPPGAETDAPSQVSSQAATLNGQVNSENQTTSYRFAYGTSPTALTSFTPSAAGPSGQSPTAVSATLSGLSPSTTYYYRLVVSAGASTYSGSVLSFTTSSSSVTTQTPVVATGQAGRVSAGGALLTGTINPGGPSAVKYAFRYGTAAANLSHSTPSSTLAGGTTAVPVSGTLTGLRPATRYYVQLTATLNGQTRVGAVRSFTTARRLPSVNTGGAQHVVSTGAQISGWVNPHGTATVYQVQFGPSSRYGYSTILLHVGTASTSQHVSTVLVGLHPATTYHYRLVARNDGGTVVGSDRTFTTARRLVAAPRFGFRAPTRVSRHALRSGQERVSFHCSKACTAHFELELTPAGISRTAAVPLTIARGRAQLGKTGSGTATLFVVRGRRSNLAARRSASVKVLLLGYAIATRSSPSAPREERVRLF